MSNNTTATETALTASQRISKLFQDALGTETMAQDPPSLWQALRTTAWYYIDKETVELTFEITELALGNLTDCALEKFQATEHGSFERTPDREEICRVLGHEHPDAATRPQPATESPNQPTSETLQQPAA